MSKITVVVTPDGEDANLGFESSRVFMQDGIDDATALAYFLGETIRGMGYNWVDDVVLVKTNGDSVSSYDYNGSKLV